MDGMSFNKGGDFGGGVRWDQANQFTVLTADVLAKYCERLDQATALVQGKAISAPGKTRP